MVNAFYSVLNTSRHWLTNGLSHQYKQTRNKAKKYIQSVPIMYHLYHYLEYEKSISSPKNAYFDLSEISQGSSLYAVATEQAKSKQLAEAASIEIMPED